MTKTFGSRWRHDPFALGAGRVCCLLCGGRGVRVGATVSGLDVQALHADDPLHGARLLIQTADENSLSDSFEVRVTLTLMRALVARVAELEQQLADQQHNVASLIESVDRERGRAQALTGALRALLEWAEKDRGGGYPEANRSEEWYSHRDLARAALAAHGQESA